MDRKPKLLDQMREQIRLRHCSIRTERVYCDRPLLADFCQFWMAALGRLRPSSLTPLAHSFGFLPAA